MRRRLVLYGVGVTVAVVLAFLVPFLVLVHSLAEDRALSAARQDAQNLAVVASHDSPGLAAVLASLNTTGPNRSTVFRPDGSAVGAPAVADASVAAARGGQAFTARTTGGAEVLLPVEGSSGLSVVRVFVPDDVLTAGVDRATLSLVLLGVMLVGVAAIVASRVARRLAAPVTDAAETAEALAAGRLEARVVPSGPPEVVELGRSLNLLGERIGHLLTAERELMADLSHRLRTPITALRLDVDGVEDREQASALASRVDDLAGQLDAVVRAARAGVDGVAPHCDAAAVVRERAAFWAVLAEDQGRAMTVDTPTPPGVNGALLVPVAEHELAAALDVLVDNVFTHTADGVGFTVGAARRGTGVRVRVGDGGSGVPASALAERGRSRTGSTGLGLDIARRCVETVGGTFELTTGLDGGVEVRCDFPPAPPRTSA